MDVAVAIDDDGTVLLLLLLKLLLELELLPPRPSGLATLFADVPAPDKPSNLPALLLPVMEADASFKALLLLLLLVACSSAPKPPPKLLANCSLPVTPAPELGKADVLRFWA